MSMAAASPHQAVLLDEAVAALAVDPGGWYVDATFGRGGHARAILDRLGEAGRLLAIDRDPQAQRWAWEHFGADPRMCFERAPFGRLGEIVARRGWSGRVTGVLMDLGVSSPQLDEPGRGFSFAHDGPLDMRMDPEAGMSAAQWLATATETEIARVLRDLGEERFHRRIARAIVEARREGPLVGTARLAAVIATAVPTRERGKHPATRSFQAIRIHINRELEELASALPQAVEALAPGGRLVVISFHSLEDRIVKRFMREEARGRVLPPGLPVTAAQEGVGARLRVAGSAERVSAAELRANPRSRSAILRTAVRL